MSKFNVDPGCEPNMSEILLKMEVMEVANRQLAETIEEMKEEISDLVTDLDDSKSEVAELERKIEQLETDCSGKEMALDEIDSLASEIASYVRKAK